MWKRTIVYVFVVILSIYLFFIYDDTIMTGILLLELVYPVLSFIYLHNTCHMMEINMGYVPNMGEKGSKLRAEIILKNRLKILSIRYRVRMHISNRYFRHSVHKKSAGVLEPGKSEKAYFVFSSKYSGGLEFVLDSVEIYDLFGVFYRTVRVKKKKYIGIMPSFELMPLEITRRTREFVADAEKFSDEKSGDDPSEIYQVREYRSQDHIHAIHWKLSAKEDKLMVKEQGFPMGCVVLIWLHLYKKDINGKGISALLEKTADLSMTLLEEHCIHMIAWFDEKNLRVVKFRVDSEQSVYEWVWRLIEAEPFESVELESVYYDEAFRGEYFSSIAAIDNTGNITVNGEKEEIPRL